MFEILLLLGLVLLTKFIIDYGYKNENYFKDKGIKHLQPTFLFGNSINLFVRKKPILDFFRDAYRAFPDEK